MKTRPTFNPENLGGVEYGMFTRNQRRHDRARAKYERNVHPLPAAYDVRLLIDQTAVAAIRKAFTLAKASKDSWKSAQRTGRVDVRQMPRMARREQDVFKNKVGRSTTRVRAKVLIDASGSMRGHGQTTIPHPDDPTIQVPVSRAEAAGIFGGTIATALGRVPTVDLDVYQHSAGAGRLYLKWRWAKGTPVGAFNETPFSIGGGGNADGHALFAIIELMRKELKRGEKGVILVVSDGLPSVYGAGATPDGAPKPLIQVNDPQAVVKQALANAGQALVDAVAYGRKHNIEIIGVAIDGSDQSAYYGEGTVAFDGNWTALGKGLGQHLGAALARR